MFQTFSLVFNITILKKVRKGINFALVNGIQIKKTISCEFLYETSCHFSHKNVYPNNKLVSKWFTFH